MINYYKEEIARLQEEIARMVRKTEELEGDLAMRDAKIDALQSEIQNWQDESVARRNRQDGGVMG